MLDKIDIDPETGKVLPPVEDGADEAVDGEFSEPESPDLAIDTLKGDLRDALLSRFRMAKKPWEQMSEMEQRDLVSGMEMAAGHLVRETVKILTTHEFPHVVVKLGEMKVMGGDKGIEAKIATTNISYNREVLGDAIGTMVQIVMVDSDQFMGQRAEAKVEPDQGALPLDGEVVPEDEDEAAPEEVDA